MQVPRGLRPPRHMVTVFLAVAIVSGGALGWLAWQLLKQGAGRYFILRAISRERRVS